MRERPATLPLAVPLLLGPGIVALFSGGYSDTARAAAGLAAWLLLAATAIALPRPLPRSRPAVLALAALAGLTAWSVASLAWAPLGESVGEDVQRLLLYLAVLAAATRILREPAAARLAEPLLLAGITGAALYGLSERLAPGLVDLTDVLSAGDRLAQPLTYWNGTGAFAALGLILAAGIAGAPERPAAVRAGAAAAAPVLGLALYLTFSRGGIGAAAAGLAVLLALAPTRAHVRAAVLVAAAAAVPALATLALPAVAQEKSGDGQGAAMLVLLLLVAASAALLARRVPEREAVLPRVRLLAAGALVLALAGSAVAVTQVERQGGRDDPEATPGRLASVQSNRYAYWKVALRTFGDHPLDGVGSGGFQAEWLRERPFREPVRDAHSLYLETPAELGLPGLALVLALLASVGVAARAAAARYAGPVAALAAYALHAGVDWDWELPALTLVALVLAGLVLSAGESPSAARDAPAP
jgi:O-Antigen ligase